MISKRNAPVLLPRRSVNHFLFAGLASAFTTALATTFRVAHAAEWEKIDDADGIQVFRKDSAGTSLHAFRGTAIVDAPMEKIIWVLADNDHRTEWVDRLKKSIVLEKKGPYDFVLYQHFGAPTPVSDRDFVYRAQAYCRKDGAAVLDIASITHPKAPKTAGVRGELKHSSYVLKRISDTQTHVDVTVLTDPKGALPSWLVNMIQKSWPKNTLSALRKQVKKPFVGSLAAPPVRG